MIGLITVVIVTIISATIVIEFLALHQKHKLRKQMSLEIDEWDRNNEQGSEKAS